MIVELNQHKPSIRRRITKGCSKYFDTVKTPVPLNSSPDPTTNYVLLFGIEHGDESDILALVLKHYLLKTTSHLAAEHPRWVSDTNGVEAIRATAPSMQLTLARPTFRAGHIRCLVTRYEWRFSEELEVVQFQQLELPDSQLGFTVHVQEAEVKSASSSSFQISTRTTPPLPPPAAGPYLERECETGRVPAHLPASGLRVTTSEAKYLSPTMLPYYSETPPYESLTRGNSEDTSTTPSREASPIRWQREVSVNSPKCALTAATGKITVSVSSFDSRDPAPAYEDLEVPASLTSSQTQSQPTRSTPLLRWPELGLSPRDELQRQWAQMAVASPSPKSPTPQHARESETAPIRSLFSSRTPEKSVRTRLVSKSAQRAGQKKLSEAETATARQSDDNSANEVRILPETPFPNSAGGEEKALPPPPLFDDVDQFVAPETHKASRRSGPKTASRAKPHLVGDEPAANLRTSRSKAAATPVPRVTTQPRLTSASFFPKTAPPPGKRAMKWTSDGARPPQVW